MAEPHDPRSMRPDEHGQVMEVLERAFGFPEHFWLSRYPATAQDRFVWEDHFVVADQGRVVSHLSLHPRTLVVDGVEVPIGGVGGVATDPEHQGRGHFRRLMEHLDAVMREREIPLAVLWGRTSRYRHFRYEPAGRRMVFRLSGAGGSGPSKDVEGRGFRAVEDLDWSLSAHDAEPLRVKRSAVAQRELLLGPGCRTWVAGRGEARAYVVFRDDRVVECAGHPETALALLAGLRDRYHPEGFEVLVPYRDGPLVRGLYEMGAAWRLEAIGMFAIIDLRRLLSAYAPLLRERADARGLSRGSGVVLHSQDTGERVSVRVDEDIVIGDGQAGEAISLTALQLTRLLLGPTLEQHGRDAAEQAWLDALFPLDLYYHPLDSV